MKIKRIPPNFRKPDHCALCRAFDGEECTFYEFNNPDSDNRVCDDFRPEGR